MQKNLLVEHKSATSQMKEHYIIYKNNKSYILEYDLLKRNGLYLSVNDSNDAQKFFLYRKDNSTMMPIIIEDILSFTLGIQYIENFK